MICYGNNCNSGSIHRRVQAEHVPASVEVFPDKPIITHKPTRKRNVKRAVECVETGRVFQSIKLAADWLGMSERGIRSAADPKYKSQTCGGYHWRFV